ncbi:TetR/AcrR family transcriptional regulator [Aerolutibacter ruishenii]|uniref:TetR family transcriptional regulator n=1 Tax=Aerolutibacter ruishenii TaxID=686800 RepID=A0A562LYQ5_9GAMM|nr:TetR/AcrR family transcriptional regulator [Lysobacter ruishenii]TWI12771.1 TetR family transcriptional regulator [Lysobacter ruishenii]
MRATRLSAEERRATTVDTVIDMAAEQNPSDITTAAIAERMGLTHGALFRHFPSKDAILQAVLSWVAERLLARVDRAAEGATSSMAALEAMFMAHVDFVAERPGVPRMLFGELQRPVDTLPRKMVQTLMGRYGERLRSLLEAGKASGELDPGLDVEAAILLFIGTIQGLVIQAMVAGDVGRIRRDAQRVFSIYRRGISGGGQ